MEIEIEKIEKVEQKFEYYCGYENSFSLESNIFKVLCFNKHTLVVYFRHSWMKFEHLIILLSENVK